MENENIEVREKGIAVERNAETLDELIGEVEKVRHSFDSFRKGIEEQATYSMEESGKSGDASVDIVANYKMHLNKRGLGVDYILRFTGHPEGLKKTTQMVSRLTNYGFVDIETEEPE